MRKTTLALAGVLAAAFLTGCSTSPGAQNVEDCSSNGSAAAGCAVVIQYKGQPLNCVTWNGSHSETGLTCDFVEYNALYGTR